MSKSSKPAGWYPDPNDSGFEVYWDGGRWHGRRDKFDEPGDALPSTGGQKSSATRLGALFPTSVAQWRGLSESTQALIAVGIGLFAILLVGFLVWFATSKPWESQREKDCRAALQAEGFRGEDLKTAVRFCVQNTR